MGRQAVDIVLLCRYKSGQAKPLDTTEVAEVYWMSLNEILSNEKAPEWTKSIFQKAEKVKSIH